MYSCWPGPGAGRSFRVYANVGLFNAAAVPGHAPDLMLAFDVPPVTDLHLRENRSYSIWEIGKPPKLVLEIVSDRRGGEDTDKFKLYAELGIVFYVIYDPEELLQRGKLRAFVLIRGVYQATDPGWLPEVGLGLQLWTGVYEDQKETWLRWCSPAGEVVATGKERADAADERIRQLEAQLRAAGIDPNF